MMQPAYNLQVASHKAVTSATYGMGMPECTGLHCLDPWLLLCAYKPMSFSKGTRTDSTKQCEQAPKDRQTDEG